MERTDLWSARADAYAVSPTHAEGEDLDLVVSWSAGVRTALDVGAGGGHVARRLREVGVEVVTCDAARGMRPDVVCEAESLPFADRSFDLVTCRLAAHHFADARAAVREMARVAATAVIVADTVFMGESVEEAERLRDPSHVRSYSADEWRDLVTEAGLGLDDVRFPQRTMRLDAWLSRVGCGGEDAERVIELLGDRVADGQVTLDTIALRARVGF